MDLQRDLRALLQALADAEDALRPEMAAELQPDLQRKYDVFRHDVHHMVLRAQALSAEGTRARSPRETLHNSLLAEGAPAAAQISERPESSLKSLFHVLNHSVSGAEQVSQHLAKSR